MSFNLTQMGRVFTQNVNQLQKALQLDDESFCFHADISPRTLERIQTARVACRTYRPIFSTVAKLAHLGGVSVDDFVATRLTFG